MNIIKRIKMVKAMEFIVRQVNNEDIFDGWLTMGVGDGEVRPGDLSVDDDDLENLAYYAEDENFAELMQEFLLTMKCACDDGGLYCDEVVSKE